LVAMSGTPGKEEASLCGSEQLGALLKNYVEVEKKSHHQRKKEQKKDRSNKKKKRVKDLSCVGGVG